MKSLYDQAKSLTEKVAAIKTVLPLSAVLTHYSEHVIKVKVTLYHLGNDSMVIEYWGNAEFYWVKKNIEENAEAIRKAARVAIRRSKK